MRCRVSELSPECIQLVPRANKEKLSYVLLRLFTTLCKRQFLLWRSLVWIDENIVSIVNDEKCGAMLVCCFIVAVRKSMRKPLKEGRCCLGSWSEDAVPHCREDKAEGAGGCWLQACAPASSPQLGRKQQNNVQSPSYRMVPPQANVSRYVCWVILNPAKLVLHNSTHKIRAI